MAEVADELAVAFIKATLPQLPEHLKQQVLAPAPPCDEPTIDLCPANNTVPVPVPLREVICLRASGKKWLVQTEKDGEPEVPGPLQRHTLLLLHPDFMQVARSCMINWRHVDTFGWGNYHIYMKDGTGIKVSRRLWAKAKEAYRQYMLRTSRR